MQEQPMTNRSPQMTDNTRQAISDIATKLDDIVRQVRSSIDGVQEPKAQALFETSAEVLLGLKKAYDDYKGGSEKAWQ